MHKELAPDKLFLITTSSYSFFVFNKGVIKEICCSKGSCQMLNPALTTPLYA